MIRNYLKVAVRNIIRYKGYSAINIAGLSIGIAASLLLFLVIRYEYSYDTFQKEYNNIYRVVTVDKPKGGELQYTIGNPYPNLDALRASFPTIKFGALYSSFGSQVTVLKDKSPAAVANPKYIEENGLIYTDARFFEIFSYKWLEGQPQILNEPNVAVLTKAKAEKYFGNWKEALGKSLLIDNATPVTVAGIIETPPVNSDFPLQLIGSFETYKNIKGPNGYSDQWGHITSNFQIYTLLPAGVTESSFNKQLETYSKSHYPVSSRREVRKNMVQPLREIHFDTRFENLGDHVISRSTLNILSFIGVLIIIMASINFVNLSTAQAVGRSREVGVRKVLGSSRGQLFRQMMGETGLIVCISITISLALAYIVLPYVKNFVSINEPLSLFDRSSALFLLVVLIAVTFLSGVYPSLILSGFSPAQVLKNKMTSSMAGGISLRRALVVLQFGISQVLTIGTIIAVSQMNFVKNADIGFNKDAVLVINSNADSALLARQSAFKSAVLQVPGVKAVSFTSDVPSSDNNSSTNFAFDMKPDEDFNLYLKFADEDYFKTFGLQLVAGRGFARSDTMHEAVVNETLLTQLGLKSPNEAIGKNIRIGRNAWLPVVGVVKDFKTNSLRETVKPLMISSLSNFYTVTAIKLHSADMLKAKTAVLGKWDEFFPEYANTNLFMDESIDNFYQQENQLSGLYKIFAGLAIFISCLGLYGLVSFLAVQKTKEVGIRKVLGASVGNIVYLFSREFTILITIAFAIAAPIAWYVMSDWLNNFEFKIPIGAGVFILAIIISLIIAWITVGYKAIRAALANPVKSIRSE
ncbi:ABC transporter permease [Flavitalea antarctica]